MSWSLFKLRVRLTHKAIRTKKAIKAPAPTGAKVWLVRLSSQGRDFLFLGTGALTGTSPDAASEAVALAILLSSATLRPISAARLATSWASRWRAIFSSSLPLEGFESVNLSWGPLAFLLSSCAESLPEVSLLAWGAAPPGARLASSAR